MSKRPAVIIDVDGTLVNVVGITHILKGDLHNEKKLEAYHKAALNCKANGWVVSLTNTLYDQGYDVLVVTARSEKVRVDTEFWLAKHRVKYHALFMRKHKDARDDYYIKKDILKALIEAGWKPALAVDDNPSIVKLWEENDIFTIHVPGYNF
jgi:phosphoribosylpyrophosphate synthetase